MTCSPRTEYSLDYCNPDHRHCSRFAAIRRLVWFVDGHRLRSRPHQKSLIKAYAPVGAPAGGAGGAGIVLFYARLHRQLRILGLRQLEGWSSAMS